MIVENKAGAGTAIGATAVAKAPADGYTLLISSNTTFTVNAAIKRSLPYDPQKGFESIGTVGSSPLVLLANPKVAANNLKELIALTKREANVCVWPTHLECRGMGCVATNINCRA